jgi:hypothetical protein
MWKFAIIVLAAAALMQPTRSLADTSTKAPAKPSSFVPHAHTNNHVYGTPIQPAVVGHKKTSHQKHVPTKQSSSAAHRNTR